MTTTIKDLKTYAAGTEIKGFPLMIKTARKAFKDAEGTTFQEVVFMDASGEMTGHILLEVVGSETQGHHTGTAEFALWKSKTNICIMNGVLQDTDERKKESMKLVVFECFDAATPLTFDQNQELQAEDWKKLRQDEIKGKIRHGIVCETISPLTDTLGIVVLTDGDKKRINDLVDFIMAGE